MRNHTSSKRSASPAEVPDRLIRERDPLPQGDGCFGSKLDDAQSVDDVAGPARVAGKKAMKEEAREPENRRPPMPAFLQLTPDGEYSLALPLTY